MSSFPSYTAKLAIVGDTGVGKSSVAERFARGTFTPHTEMTIGAAFLSAKVQREAHTVKFQLWDTAGQERYRALAPLYYRHAHAVVVVYDITSRRSFDGAKRWMKEVRTCLGDFPVYAILGNKCDLGSERQVTEEEGRSLANEGDVFLEVSACTGAGIQDAFQIIADGIPSVDRSGPAPVIVTDGTASQDWSYCCY